MLREVEDLYYSVEQATALLRYLLGNSVLKYQDPVEARCYTRMTFAVKQTLYYRRERQTVLEGRKTPCAEVRDSESRLRVCTHLQNRHRRGAISPGTLHLLRKAANFSIK
jgi:hypothetical protein